MTDDISRNIRLPTPKFLALVEDTESGYPSAAWSVEDDNLFSWQSRMVSTHPRTFQDGV